MKPEIDSTYSPSTRRNPVRTISLASLAALSMLAAACQDSSNPATTTDETNTSGTSNTSGDTGDTQGGALRGKMIRTYLSDGLPLEVAGDALSLYVPSATGGVIKQATFEADGSFVVADVPNGPYAIYDNGSYPRFEFNGGERFLEVQRGEVGRPDRTLPAENQTYGIEVTSTGSPILTERSWVYLRSRGASLSASLGLGQDWVGEQLENIIWDDIPIDRGEGLVDSAAGDRLSATILETIDVDGAKCDVATHAAQSRDAKFRVGAVNPVHFDFVPVQSEIRDLTIDYAPLHAMMSSLVPWSKPMDASASTLISFGTNNYRWLDLIARCVRKGDAPASQRVQLPVSDLTHTSEERVIVVEVSYETSLERSDGLGPLLDTYVPAIYVPVSMIGADGKIPLPLDAVATNIRVTPSADTSDLLPYGSTPTVSWDPPSGAPEVSYSIGLLRFDGETTEFAASFNTQATSLTIPPNLLQFKDFAIQIYTYNWIRTSKNTSVPTDRIATSIPTLWSSSGIVGSDDESTDTTDTTTTDTTTTDSTSTDPDSDTSIDESDSWPESDSDTTTETFPPLTVTGVALDTYIGDQAPTTAAAGLVELFARGGSGDEFVEVTPAQDGSFSATIEAPLPWVALILRPYPLLELLSFRANPIDLSKVISGRQGRTPPTNEAQVTLTGEGVRDIVEGDSLLAYSQGAQVIAVKSLATSSTNVSQGTTFKLVETALEEGALVSASKGDILWLQYLEKLQPLQGTAECTGVSHTASLTDLELADTSSAQPIAATFTARTGPVAHVRVSPNPFLDALRAANTNVVFASSGIYVEAAPYGGRTSSLLTYGGCGYAAPVEMEANLPLSNHWAASWANSVAAEVAASVQVVGSDYLDAVTVRIVARTYDLPAQDTFDLTIAPPGTGVRNIRSEPAAAGSDDDILKWDVPAGEAPVAYRIAVLEEGASLDLDIISLQPQVELRSMGFPPDVEYVFVVTAIYGEADASKPLGAKKVTGIVPTVSRAFSGTELSSMPRSQRSPRSATLRPKQARRKDARRNKPERSLIVSRPRNAAISSVLDRLNQSEDILEIRRK